MYSTVSTHVYVQMFTQTHTNLEDQEPSSEDNMLVPLHGSMSEVSTLGSGYALWEPGLNDRTAHKKKIERKELKP